MLIVTQKPRIQRVAPCVLCAALLLQICFSQVPVGDAEAKEVLQWSDAEQAVFATSVMDRGFPENDGDRFSVLLVNRSSLVVPMLEARLEQEWKRSPRSERFVELASAMIAYSGDEESLRAISKLIAIDEQKFGPLVSRTLDNALNWRNPFTVAYGGLQAGDDSISQRIVAWSETALSSERMRRLWGYAMAEKYGRVPSLTEWANDPLVSRFKTAPQEQLRENILRFASEALAKPEKQ